MEEGFVVDRTANVAAVRESQSLARFLAIRVSPFLFLTSGILAVCHARSIPSQVSVGHLVVSSVTWCAIALIPFVSLESALYPGGHGLSEGVRIGFGHLPFVGVFLAGLWNVAKIYRSDRPKLLRIVLTAPIGFLFGSVLVYVCSFLKHGRFVW